jgi:alkyl hydroperoxide reductase subunit AhpF
MLEANLKTQLKAYLEKVSRPIEIVASLDNSPKSIELKDLLHEIATLSDRIAVIEKRNASRRFPSANRASLRASVSRAFRWAMNSRRWSWRCSRPAATRSNSTTR